MTDPFSMLGLTFSHPELNRTSNDDHRLTLAVDVPSTDVPLRGRLTLVRPQRGEGEFSQFLVDPLDLILIPPLTQEPFRRPMDAGIGIIAVEVDEFLRPVAFRSVC